MIDQVSSGFRHAPRAVRGQKPRRLQENATSFSWGRTRRSAGAETRARGCRRRERHRTRPMGAVVADSAAHSVRRPAAAARAAIAGDPPGHCQLSNQAGGTETSPAATGAVTLIQRFGSAANLNIHLHCLVLDGVYRNSDRRSSMRRRPPPSKSCRPYLQRSSHASCGC